MRHPFTFATGVALIVWHSAPFLVAGGPLLVDCSQNPGACSSIPYTWQVPVGGPAAAFYNVETGPLNADFDNATALTEVSTSFAAWGTIPTATISYTDTGSLGIDIDETNFGLVSGVADGQSPVVFDNDGDLFALLGFPSGVLGFAGPDIITVGAPFAVVEGIAVLNGLALGADLDLVRGVMVHEFGHFSNLAHSVVNGQSIFFGDETGPTPFDPLGLGSAPLGSIETMYPFIAGATAPFAVTPHADDIAALSTIYPAAGFPGSAGTITGTILRSDGTTGNTGINVIARNVSDPFGTAVSAISGDFTQGDGPLGFEDGLYTINGLSAGDYVVYIDEILAGGFSTLPFGGFTEEFYNGANESSDPAIDDPADFKLVPVASETSGIDIVSNIVLAPDPNEPNDDFTTATPVACGTFLTNPLVDPLGDLDFYWVPLLAGQIISIDVDANELGSSLDPLMGIFNTDGTTILTLSDDDPAPGEPSTLDSFLQFQAPSDGTYFVAVTAFDDFDFVGDGTTTGFYEISFDCHPANDLVMNFVSGVGTWRYMNNDTWHKLYGQEATLLSVANLDNMGVDDLVGTFSNLAGTWRYLNNNTWHKLYGQEATLVSVANLDSTGPDDLVITFPVLDGTWRYLNNTTWQKLYGQRATLVSVANLDSTGPDDLIMTFPVLDGTWRYLNNNTWLKLYGQRATLVAAANLDNTGADDLIVIFPSLAGTWRYLNNSIWQKLDSDKVGLVVVANLDNTGSDDLIVTFPGDGTWFLFNNTIWQKLFNQEATLVTVVDLDGSGPDDLILAFPGLGTWRYLNTGTWSKLFASDAVNAIAARLDGN